MIEIMNLRNTKPHERWDMFVDRSSPAGNPYPIGWEGRNRKMACDMYKKDFERQMENPYFKAYIISLINIYKRYGKLRLFCWCAPKRCHAETIKSYIERQVK